MARPYGGVIVCGPTGSGKSTTLYSCLSHVNEGTRTIVTVEKIFDGNLLDDPLHAAGTLPGFYVDAIAIAERGCWPLPLPDYAAADGEHLALYAKMAATREGFAEYLDKYVLEKMPA